MATHFSILAGKSLWTEELCGLQSVGSQRVRHNSVTVAHQAPLSVEVSRQENFEWVAITFSRGSSQPRDQTRVFCIVGRFFTSESPGKPNSRRFQYHTFSNG